jgi:precorrin-3B C17-methyltransferase
MTGQLWIVGLGPGERALLTPQAADAVGAADVIIGYAAYFEWIADLVAGKECIALPLGEETERATVAVGHAREGRRVCVISSGDAGIYGMASLVLEVLARRPGDALPEVSIVPGISAVNACAALLGAPLGHDFAVISLSDLLTPWELIERRLRAAADADFVLALLNPQSQRRTWQLPRAREILLGQRTPETPVGYVRNAYRPGQSIWLGTLRTMAEQPADMFTTIIVGNSQSREFRGRMLTPRGYPTKQTESHDGEPGA